MKSNLGPISIPGEESKYERLIGSDKPENQLISSEDEDAYL